MTEAAFLARTWPTRGEPDLILRLVPDRSASVRHWRRTCPQVFVLGAPSVASKEPSCTTIEPLEAVRRGTRRSVVGRSIQRAENGHSLGPDLVCG